MKIKLEISRLGVRLCLFLFVSTVALSADVKVPSIFGDHMVLQQDAKLPVWGTADPGENVTVTIGADTASATAGTDGKWRVDLAPLPGSATATSMTITGKNTLMFTDVLVGEVWFVAGQSNMEFPISRTKDAVTNPPAVDDSQLRLFMVGCDNTGYTMTPSDKFLSGRWILTTPSDPTSSTKNFPAVAYYFAKELRAKLNRPVGVVRSAVGGTPIKAWTPLDYLQKDSALKSYVDDYDKINATFPALKAKREAWEKDRAQWDTEVGNAYRPILQAWQASRDQAKAAGQPFTTPMPQPSRPAPIDPGSPNGGDGATARNYNYLVAPVMPFAIKGAIWYQGESNSADGEKYHAALSALITGWRDHWGQGDFPFLVVQLPRFLGGDKWPQIREAQEQVTAALPNAAFATILDVGDPNNIHPDDKKDVGQRLSLVARHLVYGEKDLVWTGPIFNSMRVEGNTIRISFSQTGSGLTIGSSPWVAPGAKPIPTNSLLGFAIAGDDKKWVAADAKIDGNTVIVSSDKVTSPVAVRYAWQNSPVCNLYNKEGLPAAPFRTDTWMP